MSKAVERRCQLDLTPCNAATALLRLDRPVTATSPRICKASGQSSELGAATSLLQWNDAFCDLQR